MPRGHCRQDAHPDWNEKQKPHERYARPSPSTECEEEGKQDPFADEQERKEHSQVQGGEAYTPLAPVHGSLASNRLSQQHSRNACDYDGDPEHRLSGVDQKVDFPLEPHQPFQRLCLPNTEISGEARVILSSAGFVRFIDEMDSSHDSVGIDVPESLLSRHERSPSCPTIRA